MRLRVRAGMGFGMCIVSACFVWACLGQFASAEETSSKDAAAAEPPSTESAVTTRHKPAPVTITPDPLKIERGKPLSTRALVSEPMPLEGCLSWTVETRLHRGALQAYDFSPDNKLLATGGLDGTIRIWNLESGELVRAMIGHNSYIYDLAWSPDGNSLASAGGWDGTMRVWDARNGMPLKVFKNPKEYSLWVSWSPDGTKLLGAGGASGWVWLWDSRTGTETVVLEVGQRVRSIDWSPNGENFAASPLVGSVAVYNSSSGKVVQSLGDISAIFFVVRWSPDGQKLACGSTANTTIYNVEDATALKELVGVGVSAAWSPDGMKIATCRGSGATTVWDAETGKSIKVIPALGSELKWREPEVLFAHDATSVASWHPTQATPIKSYTVARVFPPVWNSGRPIVVGLGSPKLTLWDSLTAKALKTLEGHTAAVTAVSWTRDGKVLASSSRDKTVRLWEAATGKLLHTLTDHAAPVLCVAWSPDGKTLASGGADNKVRLWQVTGKAVGVLEGHTSNVNVVTWSPRGNLLASGSSDMTVRLWQPDKGKKPVIIKDSQPILALAFNPDGSIIAGGTPDEVVRVWETGTGKQITKGIRSPRTSPPGVTCVSWSADGSMMLAGRANHTMQLWDLNAPKIIYDLQAMTPVQYCTWAGGGSMMVAGSSDGTVRFWDGPSGVIRGMILDEGDHIVLLSGNGNYRLDKNFQPDFFYVLQTDKEQLKVPVEDFASHYKWKNVPTQVKFANK